MSDELHGLDDDLDLLIEDEEELLDFSDIIKEDLTFTEKESLKLEKKKEKEYKDTLKKIFSSLTARRCRFIYLNILDDKDTLIFANDDRTQFGVYRSIELGIHVVKLKGKSKEIFDTFKSTLGIGEIDKPYLLLPGDYLSLTNKMKKTDTIIFSNEGKNILAQATITNKDNEISTESKIIGSPVTSINIRSVLKEQATTLLHLVDDNKIEYFDIDRNTPVIAGQLIIIPLESPVSWNVILLEGVNCPSHKEFIRKSNDFTYQLGILPLEGGYNVFTRYVDEDLEVLSIKPFNYYRP